MQPIEKYLEHVDELAQEIVNAWGVNVKAGNAALLTDEFKEVFDKACRYRTAKSVADNYRENQMSSAAVTEEERTTRLAFAEAYKRFWEKKHQATA